MNTLEIIGTLLILAGASGLAYGWHRTAKELDAVRAELRRWTDRDERGRFVRREPKGTGK